MTSPPPPSTGDEREDAASAAGQAAQVVMAAAAAAVLAALAEAVTAAVVAGAVSGWLAARRRVLRSVAHILGGASSKMRKVYADAEQAAGAPIGDVARQIEQAVLTAQQSASDAYDAAMAAALGENGTPWRAVPGVYRDVVRKAMRQKLSQIQRAQKVMDDLAAHGLTGFTDRAGRRWSLDAYAEMAVRSATSRAHLSAQLDRMAAAGLDLVIVDNPSMEAACPKCRPWEGRVLSLSGHSTGLSTITDAHGVRRTERIAGSLAHAVAKGLLHPNCRHSLVPWADGHAAVATGGGKPRGYVEHGRSVARSLPIGTPADYDHSQAQRAHERAVRLAHARYQAALGKPAKQKAAARWHAARAASAAHAKATLQVHLPHREKAGRAR